MGAKKEEAINDGYIDYLIPWDRSMNVPCKNVIVNGKKYSVPIGKSVRIPAVVAEVLDQSVEQSRYARDIDMKMQKTQVTEF